MGVVYKIHPAIGIARVGNHKDAFFIGPELLGSPGVEIGPKGREMQVLHYKKDGLTKRQAARFRVFSFEQDDRGGLKLIGEVTADDARIEWKVDLCNRKAALARAIDGHPALPRNTGIADRDSLVIRNPKPVTISGKNLRTREFNGRFLGKKVYLGELRTDAKGRLLVLGGRGQSGSVPDGARLGDWANNDKWYDDVSDGPVSAVITFPGEKSIAVHHGS
jgi:L-Lysine epsilon oxidase N-terminal